MRLRPRIRKSRKLLAATVGGASLGLAACTPLGKIAEPFTPNGLAPMEETVDGGDDAGTPLGRVGDAGASDAGTCVMLGIGVGDGPCGDDTADAGALDSGTPLGVGVAPEDGGTCNIMGSATTDWDGGSLCGDAADSGTPMGVIVTPMDAGACVFNGLAPLDWDGGCLSGGSGDAGADDAGMVFLGSVADPDAG